MAGKLADTMVERQILNSLREFYPIKVDEIVLVSSVQKTMGDASTDDIIAGIHRLRDKGYVEESAVKAPFGRSETYRFKITPSGIEHLQSLGAPGIVTGATPGEVEARIVETYDRIKADMEAMRQNLESSQKVLEGSIDEVSRKIADHDQVIRTYFVRVIETFGVFVGIFAVVVVAMLGSISTATAMPDVGMGTVAIILLAIPLILVSVILTLLYGIRELILKAPKG